MTTFPGGANPYDQYAAVPQKTAGIALASLICSLAGIVTCGVTSLLGVILGLVGVLTLGPQSGKRGRGMASAGLILGLLITAGWGIVLWLTVTFFGGFIQFVMQGPKDALVVGFAGDIAGFKANFVGDGASASDDEARAFLNELKNRYGVFSSASFPQNQSGPPPQPTPGQANMVAPYVLQFSNNSVNAEVELHFADQRGSLMKKLGFIHVIDEHLGDLWFPASAQQSVEHAPETIEDAAESSE